MKSCKLPADEFREGFFDEQRPDHVAIGRTKNRLRSASAEPFDAVAARTRLAGHEIIDHHGHPIVDPRVVKLDIVSPFRIHRGMVMIREDVIHEETLCGPDKRGIG